MVQKIKKVILSVSTVAVLSFGVLAPVAVISSSPALADTVSQNVCNGANQLTLGTGTNNSYGSNSDCKTNGEATSKVNNLIKTVLNVLSAIIGIIAVIMIIVGGFHYVTSGGNQEKVTKAKNTLLYAIIGLIIAALAQVIVQFVLNKSANI